MEGTFAVGDRVRIVHGSVHFGWIGTVTSMVSGMWPVIVRTDREIHPAMIASRTGDAVSGRTSAEVTVLRAYSPDATLEALCDERADEVELVPADHDARFWESELLHLSDAEAHCSFWSEVEGVQETKWYRLSKTDRERVRKIVVGIGHHRTEYCAKLWRSDLTIDIAIRMLVRATLDGAVGRRNMTAENFVKTAVQGGEDRRHAEDIARHVFASREFACLNI